MPDLIRLYNIPEPERSKFRQLIIDAFELGHMGWIIDDNMMIDISLLNKESNVKESKTSDGG